MREEKKVFVSSGTGTLRKKIRKNLEFFRTKTCRKFPEWLDRNFWDSRLPDLWEIQENRTRVEFSPSKFRVFAQHGNWYFGFWNKMNAIFVWVAFPYYLISMHCIGPRPGLAPHRSFPQKWKHKRNVWECYRFIRLAILMKEISIHYVEALMHSKLYGLLLCEKPSTENISGRRQVLVWVLSVSFLKKKNSSRDGATAYQRGSASWRCSAPQIIFSPSKEDKRVGGEGTNVKEVFWLLLESPQQVISSSADRSDR